MGFHVRFGSLIALCWELFGIVREIRVEALSTSRCVLGKCEPSVDLI